jgi:hypothetical protein
MPPKYDLFQTDCALGASKTAADDYYLSVLKFFKETLINSPVIFIITDYLKHIPLYHYYGPRSDVINIPYFGIYPFEKVSKHQQLELNTREFIDDFVNYIQSDFDNKSEDVYIPREIIFDLFSKHKCLTVFNKPYKISGIKLQQTIRTNRNICDYYINICPNDSGQLFEYSFDVTIKKFPIGKIDNKLLTNQNPKLSTTVINSMYFSINFSYNLNFKSIDNIPPVIGQIIKTTFREFYEIKIDPIIKMEFASIRI